MRDSIQKREFRVRASSEVKCFSGIFGTKSPHSSLQGGFFWQGLIVEGLPFRSGRVWTGGRLRAAVARPPVFGAKEGGTSAVLWFTRTQSKTVLRIGSGRGRRRLHPGTGARHLVHLSVPPPGEGCLTRAVRGGRSTPLSRDGPRPASYYVSASLLAASRDTCPITFPIWNGVAYILLSFCQCSTSSPVSSSQRTRRLFSSGMPDRS